MAYETSVFVNCPFDQTYLSLLRPLLFSVTDLGFEPRIALEELNSGRPRIDKIVRLVRESKYGIHDLSRLKAEKKGEFYRLNMPFELGLDVGCQIFGGPEFIGKRCLILEAERHRYQAALSDLSNSDIAAHGDQPLELLTQVRNWLASEAKLRSPGPSRIWNRFQDFMADNYNRLNARGFSDRDIENLPVAELLPCIADWCRSNPQ